MEQSAFVALVAEILEVEPGTISFESSLDDIDWDSLANITFIAEIDEKLGKTVSADQLNAAKTVADLAALIE